jgi:hypothetical protein
MQLTHPREILKIEVVEGNNLMINKAAELLGITSTACINRRYLRGILTVILLLNAINYECTK